MVLVTVVVVVLRYGFSIGFIWMQESVRFMYAAVFLLGAGYTLRHDAHVRVDMLYERMRPAAAESLGRPPRHGALPVPRLRFSVIYFSWDYVLNSWADFEGSIEERGLHAVYLLKTCIWLFAGTADPAGGRHGRSHDRSSLRSPGSNAAVTPEFLVGGMLIALLAALLAGFPVAFTLSGVALLAAALGAARRPVRFQFRGGVPEPHLRDHDQ